MFSGESLGEDETPRVEVSTEKKADLDVLNDDFLDESSTSSEDDGIYFKANPLEFSSESDDDKDSDVELKSSEEEELQNLYDKKLREKLFSKKIGGEDDDEPEMMTSRIGEYLKKMRSEEKMLISKLNDGKASEEEIAKNRKNKEAILKRFDYKDQLRRMKNQGFFDRYDSSESESETGSDLDFDALADTMEKLKTGKSHGKVPEKTKTVKTEKSATSKDVNIRKKIAEMKKILNNPELQEEEDQLFKTKQVVTNWLKKEGAKPAGIKEKLKGKSHDKFASNNLMKEIQGKKLQKPADETRQSARNPLPPVKTKRVLGSSAKDLKKEDVLKIIREIDSAPTKPKSLGAGLEKPHVSNTLQKSVASRVNSGLPARLLKSKSEFSKTIGKTDSTKNSVPPTTKSMERKSNTKKNLLQKTTVN